MSTIAWDGVTLAGDKQSSNGYSISTVRKVFKLKNGMGLIGMCGKLDQMPILLDWFENGCVAESWPAFQRREDQCVILHITPDGKCYRFNSCEIGYEIEDKFIAIGSGSDFAIAALYLGENAVDAVKVAAKFNPSTGNLVDFVTLDNPTT